MEQYIQGLLNAHCNDLRLAKRLPSNPAIERFIGVIKHQACELLTALYVGDKLTTEQYEKFYQEVEEM